MALMTDEKNNTNTEDTGSEGADLSIYEVGYLLIPTIAEDTLGAETATIKGLVEEKGFVVSEVMPESIELSYEMSKVIGNKKTRFSKAYFGSVIFQVPAVDISEIKNTLDKSDSIIRFLITKRSKSSLLPSKRKFLNTESDEKSEEKTEAKNTKTDSSNIDKQELDKTIDELVK